MSALRLMLAAALLPTAPALAQHAGHVAPSDAEETGPQVDDAKPTDPHAGHDMSGAAADPQAGHDMSGAAVDPHAGHAMPESGAEAGGTAGASAGDPHAGHDMSNMGGMDHGSMDHGAMDHSAMGHGTPGAGDVGDAPAPPPPADRWADRYYGATEMNAARAIAAKEHGGGRYRQILFNLAEYQVRQGRDGYRWDGEGWFGGDIDRLTVKTEGEGSRGRKVEAAEVQALWSHAVDAYWNVQAGARVDFQPGPARAYATIAVEGLAPYWFDVEGGLFLSDRGDLLGRVEAWYDQRITQRLFLQPRAELNFAAQDVPENEMGSGLVNAELGLRLRYELVREFAPYVGVSWDRKVGDTARFARAAGEGASETSFVAGVRFWF